MAFESDVLEAPDAVKITAACKAHNSNPMYIGGMEITCGTLSVIRDLSYKFDLILNCSGIEFNSHAYVLPISIYQGGWQNHGEINMPKKYNKFVRMEELTPKIMTLPWGDFQAPPVKFLFWDAFVHNYETNYEGKDDTHAIAICCSGGHGRTGTALAAIKMAYEAANDQHITDLQAINWVRDNYCQQAIEMKSQITYLNDLYYYLLKHKMTEIVEK